MVAWGRRASDLPWANTWEGRQSPERGRREPCAKKGYFYTEGKGLSLGHRDWCGIQGGTQN